ncbi:hypothetical protein [Desulfopila inferna]|uniref:hypothetical protein n=1 Tax=Desulfopila inferna TaxID=468528 RepID=UPI0019630278|nr:hypothetical protein [Desulfopila inferna]MBM9604769.1 hypothetical protein [Desulfopila inferna]
MFKKDKKNLEKIIKKYRLTGERVSPAGERGDNLNLEEEKFVRTVIHEVANMQKTSTGH